MHIEVLVEDSSGAKLIEMLLPRVIGAQGAPHTWRVHDYGGIGRIPKKLTAATLSSKKALLDSLPGVLRAHGKAHGIDAVVVVLDSDQRDCKVFLQELHAVVAACDPAPNALFRLAIEEMEAWLLGDRAALLRAYPRARKKVLDDYVQDSVCGTWELLADAVFAGAVPLSARQAGHCLASSSTSGWRRSARTSTSRTTPRPALASSAMGCADLLP